MRHVEHLLAMRAAVWPIFVVGIFGSLAYAIPRLPAPILIAICITIAAPMSLLVYLFRRAYPSKKLKLPPGMILERPPYAIRAAFGAFFGPLLTFAVMVGMAWIYPASNPPKHVAASTSLLLSFFLMCAFVSIAVYALAPVLFLPVIHSGKEVSKEGFIGFLVVSWVQSVIHEALISPFWHAVAVGSWVTLILVASVAAGIYVYNKFVPERVRFRSVWRTK